MKRKEHFYACIQGTQKKISMFNIVLCCISWNEISFTYEKRARDELALVPEVLDKNERNRANEYAFQHTSMVNWSDRDHFRCKRKVIQAHWKPYWSSMMTPYFSRTCGNFSKHFLHLCWNMEAKESFSCGKGIRNRV